MIELVCLSKRYGNTAVVDNVSAAIPAGQVTAIIGPNGAGKSTLLSMVGRLARADSGHIAVDGVAIQDSSTVQLAKRLAILKQENHTTLRLTVRELVTFGRFPHSQGCLNGEDERHVENSLGYMGLISLADRFLDELSGGQRQRAFLAMILCQDTDYILLDEPLNGLDIKHAVAIMKTLRRACDELKKTVVMVIHDLNFASHYADFIIAMKDGKIAVQGTPSQLIEEQTLSRLYDTPIAVHEVNGKMICTYFA